MYTLFWEVWPLISVWLVEQREHAAHACRIRCLLRGHFKRWVNNASIFPPDLVSSSDYDVGYVDTLRDSSSEGSDDSDSD